MNELEKQAEEIKNHIHQKYGYTSSNATALNMFDTLIAALNALGADYTMTDKLNIIQVNVEPRLSYDRKIFEIDVTDGSMQVLTPEPRASVC